MWGVFSDFYGGFSLRKTHHILQRLEECFKALGFLQWDFYAGSAARLVWTAMRGYDVEIFKTEKGVGVQNPWAFLARLTLS
jgi:hypothetical protein